MSARDDKLLETITRIDTNVAHLLVADEDKESRLRTTEKKIERYKYAHGISGIVLLAILAKLGFHLPISGD